MGRTSSAAKAKYNAKAYDRIEVTVKKGLRELIRSHAERQGLSINGYINNLIQYDMGDALREDPKDQQPKP